MVNPKTWNQLGSDGQREFNALFRQFQNSLRANGVHDGYDLDTDWQVVESDGNYVIEWKYHTGRRCVKTPGCD